jgi:hypothetical protein
MKKSIAIMLTFSFWVAFAQVGINYQLVNESRFENEIDTHYCKKLIIDNKFICWTTGLAEVGKSIVFKICIQDTSRDEDLISKGSIAGHTKTGWYIVNNDNNRKPKRLIIPKLHELSNPSYFKSYISYWGIINDTSFYAMVYDLDNGLLLREKYIGHAILYTDNLYILNPPFWNNQINEVVFKDAHFKKKLIFNF